MTTENDNHICPNKRSGWIGVDLDGTLAYYDHWRGPTHIGAPIPLMVERIRGWLAEGIEVKIFTARVASMGEVQRTAFRIELRNWLWKNCGLPALQVTNVKDMRMWQLWDDRAVQVINNTGRAVQDCLSDQKILDLIDERNK